MKIVSSAVDRLTVAWCASAVILMDGSTTLRSVRWPRKHPASPPMPDAPPAEASS